MTPALARLFAALAVVVVLSAVGAVGYGLHVSSERQRVRCEKVAAQNPGQPPDSECGGDPDSW